MSRTQNLAKHARKGKVRGANNQRNMLRNSSQQKNVNYKTKGPKRVPTNRKRPILRLPTEKFWNTKRRSKF